MDFSKRKCPECGVKGFRKKNVIDDFEAAWKDHKAVPIIVDLELYVCTNCGNYAASPSDVKKIDAAAEESIRLWSSMFIEKILNVTKYTQKKLATECLGVSEVYISDLLKKKRTPKFQFWNSLKLFAIDPEGALKKLRRKVKREDFRPKKAS